MTKCETCDRTDADLRRPLSGWRSSFGLPETICRDCLMVWYDRGVTDPDEIKRIVLEEVVPARALKDLGREI